MYEIVFDDEGKYDFSSVPDSVCKMMCDVHDNGERYSEDSRYTYQFKGYEERKGIQFGTAKACIQSYLIDKGNQFKKFNINTIKK